MVPSEQGCGVGYLATGGATQGGRHALVRASTRSPAPPTTTPTMRLRPRPTTGAYKLDERVKAMKLLFEDGQWPLKSIWHRRHLGLSVSG